MITDRDVIAKCLYEGIFDWIVSKQKDLTNVDKKKPYESIGILDISGFEMLNVNSLEQLCINYCNERSQKLFTSSYFDEEKILFEKEGLSKYILDFKPTTNEEIMRVVDNPKGVTKGIFQGLEDTIKSSRGDTSFLVNISESLKHSPLFSKNRLKNDKFTIYHSCYPVEYTVKDFVEKGKDELPSNILLMMDKSNPKIKLILSKTIQTAVENTKMINYVDQFKNGISNLINDLERSRCNFLRCIKPNSKKASGVWDTPLVLNQLKFLGVKDYLIMKKSMYPLRIEYKDFCKKYLELNYTINDMFYELENKPSTNFKDLARDTYKMINRDIKDENILFGKKRIFANYNTFDLMDEKLKALVVFL